MADIFRPADVDRLLAGKHVVFLGDSNVRAIYKDFIWLANTDSLIPMELLKMTRTENFPQLEEVSWMKMGLNADLQKIFSGENRDERLEYDGQIKGREYREVRRYRHRHGLQVTFRFITRIWSEQLRIFLTNYKKENDRDIDTILINSSLWDLCRWGPHGPEDFSKNLSCLLDYLAQGHPTCQVVYLTTPPCAPEIVSPGMEVPGLEFNMLTTCHQVVHANECASRLVASAGHMVLDLHFYLQMMAGHRSKDGIHWNPKATRLMTILVLTTVALDRGLELPANVESFAVEKIKRRSDRIEKMRQGRDKALSKLVTCKTVSSSEATLLAEEMTDQADRLGAAYEQAVMQGRLAELPEHPTGEEQRYYGRLSDLYRRHEGAAGVPHSSEVTSAARIRVYRDKEPPHQLRRDSLQEFLDTNHPLWWPLRQGVADLLERSRDSAQLSRGLATLVAVGWPGVGLGTSPNTLRNLTRLSGEREAEGGEVEDEDLDMMEANLKLMLAKQAITMDTFMTKRANLKRKREQTDKNPPKKQIKKDFLDKLTAKKLYLSMVYDSDVTSMANLEFSFNQAEAFNSLYNKEISADSVFELASMENVVKALVSAYKSPYIGEGRGVVPLAGREVTSRENELQDKLAQLKSELSKDRDLEKYMKKKERLENSYRG